MKNYISSSFYSKKHNFFYPIVIPKGGRKAGDLRFDGLYLKIPASPPITWMIKKRLNFSILIYKNQHNNNNYYDDDGNFKWSLWKWNAF